MCDRRHVVRPLALGLGPQLLSKATHSATPLQRHFFAVYVLAIYVLNQAGESEALCPGIGSWLPSSTHERAIAPNSVYLVLWILTNA